MTAWLRAARRRRAGAEGTDAGMTLPELLVAMFVGSILLVGVATVFSGTMKGVRVVNAKTATTADARIAMEAITRSLRVAYKPTSATSAIVTAKTDSLSFYALLNRTGISTAQPLPTLVEYSWDGTCLTEAQTPGRTVAGGGEAWDTGRTSKCLARTSIAPVFSYYASGDTPTAMAVPAAGLALMGRQTVISIQAAVTVQDPGNPGVSGVPIIDRVTLINVQTAAGGS